MADRGTRRSGRSRASTRATRVTPAGPAVRAALAASHAAWLAVLPDLRRACEPEALHDARVALRRARNVLRQMRSALPRGVARELAAELRWLRASSGEERDLDVLLASLGKLRGKLSARAGSSSAWIEVVAREEHERARMRFLRALRSPRAIAVSGAWQAATTPGRRERGKRAAGKRADQPVAALLARRLAKRHARILAGKKLTQKAPAVAFHELRIECKKLRDLVDAFPVLPPSVAGALTREMKRMQNAFGAAQDAHVSARLLRELEERASRRCPRRMLARLAKDERQARAEALRALRAHARGSARSRLEAWIRAARENRA